MFHKKSGARFGPMHKLTDWLSPPCSSEEFLVRIKKNCGLLVEESKS